MFKKLFKRKRKNSKTPAPKKKIAVTQPVVVQAPPQNPPVQDHTPQTGAPVAAQPVPTHNPPPPPPPPAKKKVPKLKAPKAVAAKKNEWLTPPEELCGIDPNTMSRDTIRHILAALYKRHNSAVSSLNPELRAEARQMLDAIVECRIRYIDR